MHITFQWGACKTLEFLVIMMDAFQLKPKDHAFKLARNLMSSISLYLASSSFRQYYGETSLIVILVDTDLILCFQSLPSWQRKSRMELHQNFTWSVRHRFIFWSLPGSIHRYFRLTAEVEVPCSFLFAGKATCVKFGLDAKYLAVGSMDRNLRIFGLPEGDDASTES